MKLTDESVTRIKQDFPLLNQSKEKPITYLDNAATTQKPEQVLKALDTFYRTTNANIHRGIYTLSEQATKHYAETKATVATFIHAKPTEIIYTRGTTESLNTITYALLNYVQQTAPEKTDIVISAMEHHSNLVPWQQLAKKYGMNLRIINITSDYTIDQDDAKKKITEKTAVLSFCHISNTLGTINPIKELTAYAHSKGAYTVIDAAQSAAYMPLDVEEIGCDALAFSSHKMFGPMGIGVLYVRESLLQNLPPVQYGGDMISTVTYQTSEWNDIPMKFEAGTPNVAGAVGLQEAITYIEQTSRETIKAWVADLAEYTVQKLKEVSGVTIYRPKQEPASGIVSFTIRGVHHHDLASYLNEFGICIRVGHHCTMPLMDHLSVSGTARISVSLYTTHSDIDYFIEKIKEAVSLFSTEKNI